MKSTDLRIGNIVRYNNKDLVVRLISNWEFSKNEIQDDISLTECEPIPLTEEWLLDLGFKAPWKGKKIWVCKGVMVYFHSKHGFCYGKASCRAKIPYVHTVQNLFHVMRNGEELIIK